MSEDKTYWNHHRLLDHGYVRLIENWGHGDVGVSEAGIIEAARMSTNKAFQGWGPIEKDCMQCDHRGMVACASNSFTPSGEKRCPTCQGTKKHMVAGDEKLLEYLYTHNHMTPFEMAGMVIELEAPIMVFREWHRHRTQSYNEMSARYIPLPDVNYVPSIQRLMGAQAATTNKQAQRASTFVMTEGTCEEDLAALAEYYERGQTLYNCLLERGWPKELARLPITVGRYSKMRASANLRNWLAFLTLRMDPAAQWEIRQYANAVGTIIETVFPRTWKLFNLGR